MKHLDLYSTTRYNTNIKAFLVEEKGPCKPLSILQLPPKQPKQQQNQDQQEFSLLKTKRS